MRVFLCRHGQTTGDVEDRYGGDYDDHLTELGKNQAQELGEKLRGKGIKKIFSSSKIRAIETSEILRDILGCEIEVAEDFRERNQYGILTGLVKSVAKERFPDLPEKLKDYRNTIDGAETYELFQTRVNQSLQNVSKLGFDAIAVVTHGGPIKAILRQISYSFDYKIEDCAIAELDISNGKARVVSLSGIQAV